MKNFQLSMPSTHSTVYLNPGDADNEAKFRRLLGERARARRGRRSDPPFVPSPLLLGFHADVRGPESAPRSY